MLKDTKNFVDVHYHCNPDLYERRHDVLRVGKIYEELGAAVVLKSHLGATTAVSSLALSNGLPVYGSVVMNSIAGGLNFRTIAQALSEYKTPDESKMIAHFPTITGRAHKSSLSRNLCYPTLKQETMKPETITNSSGELKPSVIDIVKFSRDYPVILSTGHASKLEVLKLIEACDKYNIKKLMLNQPASPMTGLKYQDLLKLSKYEFVWVEQTALTFLLKYQTWEDFSDVLLKLPRVIYSSDLGQTSQMDIKEWVDQSDKYFHTMGVDPIKRQEICKNNPIQLLT